MPGEKLLFFVLLMGLLVLVHELGHFLVAKACGVQVFKFSIGFGPELFARQIGETRYAISAIPLGGFVRMAGEDDLIERWGGPNAPPPDPERLLNAKPRWQRAAIIVAGPLANLLLPWAVFSVVALGEQSFAPPIAGSILPDTPAHKAGMQAGDRIVSVDGQAVATFADIARLIAPREGQRIRLGLQRGERALQIELTVGGRDTQDELKQNVRRGQLGVGAFVQEPVVHPGPGGGAAERAGVRALDRVLRVDGREIRRYPELSQALGDTSQEHTLAIERRRVLLSGALWLELPLRVDLVLPAQASPIRLHAPSPPLVVDPELDQRTTQHADTAPIEATLARARQVLAASPDGVLFAGACLAGVIPKTPAQRMGLRRGDCLLAVDGRTAFHWSLVNDRLMSHPERAHVAAALRSGELVTLRFRLQSQDELVALKRGLKRYVFGAVPAAVIAPGPSETRHNGPLQALRRGFEQTADMVAMTVRGVGLLLSGRLPFASVGGPMMLYDIAGRAAERGAGYFFFILAFISINLAVLNLLPVPVLDGGHLLIIAIEALRRRPLPRRAAEIANLIGLSLLLLLMTAVMGNDLSRYWESIVGAFR